MNIGRNQCIMPFTSPDSEYPPDVVLRTLCGNIAINGQYIYQFAEDSYEWIKAGVSNG